MSESFIAPVIFVSHQSIHGNVFFITCQDRFRSGYLFTYREINNLFEIVRNEQLVTPILFDFKM